MVPSDPPTSPIIAPTQVWEQLPTELKLHAIRRLQMLMLLLLMVLLLKKCCLVHHLLFLDLLARRLVRCPTRRRGCCVSIRC